MRYKSSIFKAALFLTAASLAVWLVVKFNLCNRQGFEIMGKFISSFGPFSAVIFIAFFSLRTLIIVIPFWVMVVLGGNLFGSVHGFIYSMISAFIASSLAYFVGKYFGNDFIHKHIKGRLQVLDDKAEIHGFKIVLFMRLLSVFPFDIMNYAVGVTKIRYRDFILATLIGILPETFSFSFMGSSLNSPMTGKFYAAIALILVTIGFPILFKSLRKKNSQTE